jgi:TolB-like protein/class 3 adenylate cyclase/Tfp pilus assembly protein PilF
VNAQSTSAETKPDLALEIAHLLLIDVVGYSKLLVNEQIELLQELNQTVRNTACFRAAEASGKLIRVSTGDGMALLFFHSPEEPVRCALEISSALQGHSQIQVRMGVHSGPVNRVTDVNDKTNIAGSGINVAQRVMDCGDAGHILLSGHIAEDLCQYRHWQPYLHDLGECEVKHRLRLHLFNLCKDGLGNPQVPEKLKRGGWKYKPAVVRPISVPRSPKFPFLVAVGVSGSALIISSLIFFHRASSPPVTSAASGATPRNVAPPIPEKSIAVLPFENLSDNKQDAYFTDGVQDEILTDLTKVADLKVISRTSVMQYRTDVKRSLREIAQALGVAHILEGSIQRVGDRVRVRTQLIDARSDMHIWGDQYDREISDVFAIQTEIAEQIVAQLKAKLSPEEKAAIEERPTANLEAYAQYVEANALLNKIAFNSEVKDDLAKAERLLNQATTRDPAFVIAYCRLAKTHDTLYFLNFDHTHARIALAEAALNQALRLRPNSGEVHLARAEHLYRAYLDYAGARRELMQASRKLPNESLVYELLGYIERRSAQWEQSVASFKRALDLDPRNLHILQQLSFNYTNMRRFADAAAILDRAITLVPDNALSITQRAALDLEWRADPTPLHIAIEKVVARNPEVGASFAQEWLYLAACERDGANAARAIQNMTPEGCRTEGVVFPHSWCEARAAALQGKADLARNKFHDAKAQIEKQLREQPDLAVAHCVLGFTEAMLGNSENAVREGQRAVELLPPTKDAINGVLLLQYLAVIYAWTGHKDLAIQTLEQTLTIPSEVSYGNLRLNPHWDPLRGDPRFEAIVAKLTPAAAKSHN